MQLVTRISLGWVTALLLVHDARAQDSSQLDAAFGPPLSVPRELAREKVRLPARNRIDQPIAVAQQKSRGCLECHSGIEEMHQSPHVVLGCTDCHGGNATPGLTQTKAHVEPRNEIFWKSSANPSDANVLLNHETVEFIQFVNPADLRVAHLTCGLCHAESVDHVQRSMMNHGAMLWGAALYNNGSYPVKNPHFSQAYGPGGAIELHNPYKPSPEETRTRGVLEFLEPLPRFALSQPGNILRIFEKGGEKPLQLGNPFITEPPGRPARRLSDRGLGTNNRTDPVFLGLQKTRLHDPLLGFLGSNNRPGDYRSSGCSACHVVYANDRSPTHSDYYSKFGHQGLSFSSDPSIPKDERGHPIHHRFTRSIPTSQCMVCHMHQGNLFVNPYLGYTWWDQESDGQFMYPRKQRNPTDAEMVKAVRENPEAAAARGLWGDLDFLEKVAELNPQLEETQFADYHGHGWIFRAVFKKDRYGNLLTLDDKPISNDDVDKFSKAVHLKDVHLARGMHCVDCHFREDVHGNGKLYGEPRAATTIECIDCHGTIQERATLVTSGNGGAYNLAEGNTPWGPRFYWEGERLYQRSTLRQELRWEVPQTVDTISPGSHRYNEKSRYAKTLRRDGETWGDVPKTPADCRRDLAHDNSRLSCQVCHTSWATSCFGCHLPMKANQYVPSNKYEGVTTRNFTSYNPQVVRDDVFMLGIDGTVKSNRMAVIRSSSAVVVGSQNQNREWIYSQQQTVSSEGYSGQAFNPHFAHTTSGVGTTKNCTDCHISKSDDNNAIMTQLLGFGTGTVNFFGRYAYVGAGSAGLYGIAWTEQEEPQAAIGSHLQWLAYPDNYTNHLNAASELKTAYHHHARDIRDLTLRGEYLYTANGPDGLEVFDVANIDHKGFSERIVTAPVSPLGQRTYVRTRNATSVILPSTLGIDPLRTRLPENEEQPISMIYAYVFVTDSEEGLVVVSAGPLVDGDPANNFLERATTFNPDGKLNGAVGGTLAGRYLYVLCDRGIVVVDVNEPTQPLIVAELCSGIARPRSIAIQFRYAFVTDSEGLKVIDVTNPTQPKLISDAFVSLKNAQRLYLARTYAYVANGSQGLAIIDIERPHAPKLHQMFNADGRLKDTRAIQIGAVNASMFGLVADGKNGFHVLQLISPGNVPQFMGFTPPPNPKWIATYPTDGEAVAISRGLDRDRVVDESGNQTVVFGRRGARPFNLDEMAAFFRPTNGNTNQTYQVNDAVMADGKLKRADGTALANPLPFVSQNPTNQIFKGAKLRIQRRGK